MDNDMLVPFSPFPGIFLTENAAIAAAIAAINEIYGSPIAVKTIAAAEPESRIIEIFLCSFRFMANGITSAEEEIPSIWAEIFPKVSSAESCFPEITERAERASSSIVAGFSSSCPSTGPAHSLWKSLSPAFLRKPLNLSAILPISGIYQICREDEIITHHIDNNSLALYDSDLDWCFFTLERCPSGLR